jgi:hypothetical protein
MSEPAHDPAQSDGEGRNLPVPASVPEARPIETPEGGEVQRRLLASLPAPAVAAAGGFVMGVATWVLVRVLRRERRSPIAAGRRRARKSIEVAATRSFLVDVHVLKQR